MRINTLNLKEIVAGHYTTLINTHFGAEGLQSMRELLTALSEIHKYIALEVSKGPIILIKEVNETNSHDESYRSINHYSQLSQIYIPSFTIKLKSSGQLLFQEGIPQNIDEISMHSLIYIFDGNTEAILVKGTKSLIPRLIDSFPSAFAIPTFNVLEDALEHYKTKMVRHSSCKILSNVWNDSKRIFLANAPEHTMRDSLTQFLKSCLRGDVEIRPEQVVDESHPVDIKVTWLFTNRLALIEIKWLGKSIGKNGKISNNHTDYRARQGAKQLAEYLDSNKIQAPTQITRGYLVLIDARRRDIDVGVATINNSNGLYYDYKEIEYDPKYHESRIDFSQPYRMFVEPICG